MRDRTKNPGLPPPELLAEVVFWPARIMLLVMVFSCPWYYGSVAWQAQAYLLPITIAIFVLTIAGALLRKQEPGNPLVWCLAALLALALFQTVQLPDWLWQATSTGAAFERTTERTIEEFKGPADAEKAPADGEIVISNTPRTLSIHWVQTRASTVMLALTLACLISGGVLFRTQNWELAVLGVLAVGGLTMSGLGLLQSVAWNKWTLLPMPTSTYFATFVSRNSAPQFLSIGLGAVLGLLTWWSGSKKDEADKKYYVRYPAINAVARFKRRLEELVTDLDAFSLLCIFSATLILVAVLAAGSRGGILSCFAAAVLTLCMSLGTKESYARSVGAFTLMACGTLLLLTTLELDSALLGRLDTVNAEAYMLDNGRFTLWQMILSQPSCWVPGCGLGNFHFAILPTYTKEPMAWFYHAENIYIELLAEFGIVGLALGLSGVGWLLLRIRWCTKRGHRVAPIYVATVLAVSAIGLQSLVDFSLIIPSICLPLATLVGCFLGRSYSSDFGKKTRINEHRKTEQRDTEYTRFANRHPGRSAVDAGEKAASLPMSRKTLPTFALFGLVLLSTWVGSKPLRGYAFAERLNGDLKTLEIRGRTEAAGLSAEQILADLDPVQVEFFADHPEVNLQIGRLYQVFVEDSLAEQLKLPPNTTPTERASLSEPANVAAAFRAMDDPKMTALRELTSKLPQQIEALKRSAVRMAAAASVCSFDWRTGWGVVRSDLNLLSPLSRARNYARLAYVTGQSSSIPAKIGAAALAAGEKPVGIRFLHDYLKRIPRQAVLIASGFVDQMDVDTSPADAASELRLVLPKSPLLRVEVAEHFSRVKGRAELAQQLSSSVQIEEVFAEVEQGRVANKEIARSWQLVAWLASNRGDLNTQIKAMENAVGADPMNHALRFDFAKLLLDVGQIPKANEQAGRASRLSPETRLYEEFLEKNRDSK